MRITVKDTLSTSLEDLPGEIWEDIPGYNERYKVSNYGRVKSYINRNPIIIKKSLSLGKYKVLLSPQKGRLKNEILGRLVASAFIRLPEENEVVRYKDRNVFLDTVDNLEWISRKESARRAVTSGRFHKEHGRALRNGMSILSPISVKDIRSKKASGKTLKQLSDEYKVSINCIQSVVQNRTWKTIK